MKWLIEFLNALQAVSSDKLAMALCCLALAVVGLALYGTLMEPR